jgi:hypothetical protein
LGRVERAIRYVRDNFFAARQFTVSGLLSLSITHNFRICGAAAFDQKSNRKSLL